MPKLYSGGWEGPAHFKEVARWYDPDWEDVDVQPRIWLAWLICDRNIDSAIGYLLNQWERNDEPMAYDLAEAFMDIPFVNIYEFEDAAKRFLNEISYLDPKLSMQSAKDHREFDLARIGRDT